MTSTPIRRTHSETLAHLASLKAPAKTTRKCNDCGKEYPARRGQGGSLAYAGDLENFPFEERTQTGVRADRPHWMNGAFCSEECYAAAYYEPPSNY